MRVRSHLFALILTAFLLSGMVHRPVAAQEVDPARFTPLEPGNLWEYSVEQVDGSNAPGSFLRFEVEVADTLIRDRRYAILGIHAFDADLNRIFLRRCAFYIEMGEWPDLEPLGGDSDACSPASIIPLPPRLYQRTTLDDTVSVGGQLYPVEAGATYVESLSGVGGTGFTLSRQFAADIGCYKHDRNYLGRDIPPVEPDQHWIATLMYAEVNGVTYGSEKIATALEQPPGIEDEASRIAMLYPNPFQHEVHFEVEGLQAGPARAELFDITGRRVLAMKVELGGGPTTLRLNNGPSGIYLLRVTDVSGGQVRSLINRVASEGD